MLFLKHYGSTLGDYFGEGEEINIAIGKGHEALPENTLCIGNCTARHRDKGIFVKGCPPVESEIIRIVSGNPSEDSS